MKKGLIFTVVFIILLLSGCKNTRDDTNTDTNYTAAENSQSMYMTEEKPTQSETETVTQLTTGTTPNIVYEFEGQYLKRVIIDGKTVVENDYNNIGKRSVKKGIDDCKFTYDENKNLIKEERNGKVITYFYKEDEEYQYWHIIGFSYEGNNYYYTRDDLKRIDGIQNESGELIAKYEYESGNNKVEKVMEKQGEKWVSTDDSKFIGNINRIRDISEYYDLECDLYYQYNGVFFHAVTNSVINY